MTEPKTTKIPGPENAASGVRFVLGAGLLLLAGFGLWYWYATHGIETTDDAFIEGRAVEIAPHINGAIIALNAADNQFVHTGDPIFQIDPRDYEIALDQARGQALTAEGQYNGAQHALSVAEVNFPAKLAEAEADLRDAQATLAKAEANAHRQHHLPRQATTQEQIDADDAALLSAKARVDSARAALEAAKPIKPNIAQIAEQVRQLDGARVQAEAAVKQAELNLARCTIRASQDGWVTKRAVEIGTYVQTGQQLALLVSPEIWVMANFKESQLHHMRPGQKVSIEIDAYPQLHLHGHVDSVQLGTGNRFTAFPAENATGNYVKIVQRVPVKIVIDRGLDPNVALPLGLSAVPRVDVEE
jgi:membrane fusion protein (multidrug efflux system)